MLPFSSSRPGTPPDLAPLRRAGWVVQSLTGCYAVAFQGALEVVFVWRGDDWHRLATRSHDPARRAA